MADRNNKNSENVPGRYYVDIHCIACDACTVEAPDFFSMNDIQGYAFVKRQPVSPHEIKICESARAACPVESIGNDEEIG